MFENTWLRWAVVPLVVLVAVLVVVGGVALAGIDPQQYTPWGESGYRPFNPDEFKQNNYRHEVNVPHLPSVPAGCYKVQTHAHATYGVPFAAPNTSAREVAEWYYEAGFNVVMFTDLNFFTNVKGLQATFNQPNRFLIMPGIEFNYEPVENTLIHDMMGYGGDYTGVTPPTGTTVPEIISNQVKAVLRARGIPILPHPNLAYSTTVADLLAANPAPIGLEIWNTEPGMNFMGGGGVPSVVEMWDEWLTMSGTPKWGVAADDSHHFADFGPQYANPGGAWITVCTADGKLTEKGILEAIKAGSFYASTGVELTMSVNNVGIVINLSDAAADIGWSEPGGNPTLYTTRFVGANGVVLKTDTSLTPSYTFDGTELYVRAEITNSDGQKAWTQPVFP